MENTLRQDLNTPLGHDFALIETMLWTPEDGVQHRARHMARLTRSARHFGIAPQGLDAALDAVTGTSPLRLRLTVSADGAARITSAPFTPLAPGARWRIAIHSERLDAADPWLAHKTTRRALYDAARAALPEGIDEYIFLNRGGALCEGAITNIYVDPGDGILRTPPRACGCLPGIGREALIAARRARPQRLTPDDLRAAQAIFVGNALRGLIPATLVSSC
ncbi:4-amino-4-deoxychorismate lyase [Roseovarius nanhaiticus]|uniref:Probable branched-chain-amino-acid aminotransferase n=1 Tax=Roseovarius nanhaiticus TaxID=573024 RepID=A0A1N7FZD7_9RHOB|nr:aminotransferase class IV family protein [Roseovarius nanhaiticus]SEK41333.1 4-amino-4-deoxychorismate lyase [Roseovarius nanhaiticus]SIS05604.1 4-amino-4-deoxychorismate lyase [Roseovarius nanhaiticus]